jgi:CSLREA domain-containing protein
MRFAGFVLIGLLVASAFFLPKVSSQLKSENVPAEKTESVISIRAKDRGFPRVNFEDGKDLSVINDANQNAAPAKLLTSADFDSDGTHDLITADSGGNLRFYRGNADSIYPNSAEAATRRETGTFTEAAFLESGKSFFLPISPDFLFAGDFNADGHQDILAAAKNDTALHLLAGDGAGNFAGDFAIEIDGRITALTTGEIGRRDGQADLAAAVLNKKGAQLLVFEHPEGAFKYKPETIRLPSQANDLAIGNLDEDFYADVAVAGGNKLTVVHGRGQAYPWDLLREYDIKRPAAISETRVLPFEVAALTVGAFTEKRGDSLAILTTGGTLQTLDSPAIEKPKYSKSKIQNLQSSNLYVPSGLDSSRFAVVGNDSPVDEKTVKNLETFPSDKEDREKYLLEKNEKFAEELQKLSAEEQKKMTAEGIQRAEESRTRAKAGFLKTIAPREFAPLKSWNLLTLASDARLTRAAFSANAEKLIRVRVSGSGKDELALLDASAKQIHLFVQADTSTRRSGAAEQENRQAEIISFDVETSPAAILPMRLNADALSDLVVLREGAATPSIVLTAPASIITVNTAASSGGSCDAGDSCSLHQAIIRANVTAGADVINFNINGGGAATIIPTTELRDIQDTVTIDGTTQPGFSGTPLIEIKGADISGAADGLQINASSVVLRGLAINEFKSEYDPKTNQNNGGNGISIFNFANETYSRNNIIEGNYLGTDLTGTIDKGNDSTGVLIFDSDDNTIGGTTAAARNVMSGSGTDNNQNVPRKIGVGLAVIDGQNTKIKGNYIGTNAFGTAKINNSYGVYFAASNSEFGGDETGAGNTVSGNGDPSPSEFNPERCFGVGISEETLINLTTGELITRNNNYKGNRIGTNAAGTAALRNCNTGLVVKPLHTAIVGSITETGRNTISGNRENGVYCSNSPRSFERPGSAEGSGELPPGFCDISGNNIGTDVSGSISIPNEDRNTGSFVIFFGTVAIYNTDTFSNVGAPGGTSPNACTGFCNLISGNTGSKGMGRGSLEGLVGVFNNYVGTNKNGTAALPNYSGVGALSAGLTLFGGVGVDDNDAQISLGNLISGNLGDGIDLEGPNGADFYEYAVLGNYIGTDKTGVTAIPNNSDADSGNAAIFTGGGAFFPTIGGTDPLERNIIAGNGMTGIFLGTTVLPSIVNNYIGVNKLGQPLGNGLDGIYIGTVGGSLTQANVIAYNGRNGVYVPNSVNFNGSPAPQNRNNTIRMNSIYSNSALGIDLTGDTTIPVEPDGVTQNDCQDEDEAANRLQNFPVLTAPTFNGNGTITVEGALSSLPSSDYTIDFYANTSADPTKYGEGETYIGSQDIRTEPTGLAVFLFTSTVAVSPDMKITATATDVFGNTSEFSCAAGLCAPEFTDSSKDKLRNLSPACALPEIVVNINTDQADPSPENGICDVIPATPVLDCSLRAAIQTANGKDGNDYITFNIPGDGIQTIAPTSALPEIIESVFLDATTQPGYSSTPVIEVRGDNAGASDGLVFRVGSNNSVVQGMAINRFSLSELVLQSNGNLLEKSFIGLDANGAAGGTVAQNQVGISITGNGNILSENLISNNGIGVLITGSSTGNKIFDNKIGTNAAGSAPIPNEFGISAGGTSSLNQIKRNLMSGNTGAGVSINTASSSNVVQSNTIGTNLAETASIANSIGVAIANNAKSNKILENLISGNSVYGINIVGNSTKNTVMTNKIGTNSNGTARIPNGNGVYIESAGIKNEIIENLISGNTSGGVVLFGTAHKNILSKNKIGTNLAGTGSLHNAVGIRLEGEVSENQIEENTISGNSLIGVTILENSDGNLFFKNQIGTNIAGDAAIPNQQIGVRIAGFATSNKLKFNTISGNVQVGVLLTELSTGTIMQGNKIGTNKLGDAAIPNEDGINITRSNNIADSSINGITENLISGNSTNGIFINGFRSENEITNNKIGTDEIGNTAIPNKFGIRIEGDIINTQILRNTISGNYLVGVYINENAGGTTISSNKIGTNPAGTAKIQMPGATDVSAFGIRIGGSSKSNEVSDNLVSGHRVGILVGETVGAFEPLQLAEELKNRKPRANGAENPFIFGNKVLANTVGLNASRNAAIPNFVGIAVGEDARNNFIGTFENTNVNYNLISGNINSGILIGTFRQVPQENRPQLNIFQRNLIGLSSDGPWHPLANGTGIIINNAIQNTVGSDNFNRINIIVGNGDYGIKLLEGAKQNKILKNYVGNLPFGFNRQQKLSPAVENFGNGGGGILIADGAEGNIIGDSTPDSAPVIADNGGNGITISSTAGNGNKISAGSIFANLGLGIDINGDGIITPNDLHDADAGPNNLQNYPEIVSHQFPGGNLVVNFKVDSAPTNSDYGSNGIYVEFFKADSSGEGEKFLGFGYYTVADYNGGSPLVKTVNLGNAATLGITIADRITATATDASGNTSEFTPAFAPTAANVSIGGRILSADGSGVFKARISITGANGETRTTISNSFGYYEFPNVGVGQTYIVAVRHKKYQFEPPTRVLMVTEELTNVDFTTSP